MAANVQSVRDGLVHAGLPTKISTATLSRPLPGDDIRRNALQPLLRPFRLPLDRPCATNGSRRIAPGAPHAVRRLQGRGAGRGRGTHRIPARLVHRPPAAARALLRLRRRRVRQDVRGADPARRDSGDPVDLFSPSLGDRDRRAHQGGAAPLHPRRADRVPARRDHRCARAFVHQGRAVQRVDRLHRC